MINITEELSTTLSWENLHTGPVKVVIKLPKRYVVSAFDLIHLYMKNNVEYTRCKDVRDIFIPDTVKDMFFLMQIPSSLHLSLYMNLYKEGADRSRRFGFF